MGLLDSIKSDLTTAVKAHEKLKTETLRGVLASVHNAEIEKKKELTDEEVFAVFSKEAKKRKEAIEVYGKAGRSDLEEKEKEDQEEQDKKEEEQEHKVAMESVRKESPAGKAGLKAGDIILSMDDERVRKLFDVIYHVRQKKAGDTCLIEILRGEEKMPVEVTFFETKGHGKK